MRGATSGGRFRSNSLKVSAKIGENATPSPAGFTALRKTATRLRRFEQARLIPWRQFWFLLRAPFLSAHRSAELLCHSFRLRLSKNQQATPGARQLRHVPVRRHKRECELLPSNRCPIS